MRILYIAFDNPAVTAIINGMDIRSLSGLPAFFFPFRMLVEQGHTVDLLLYSSIEYTVTNSPGFSRENLIQIQPKHSGLAGTIELPLRLRLETMRQLKRQHYDFVYGMTEGSVPGLWAAVQMGIPCALRQFGTQEMANVLEERQGTVSRWLTALKNYPYISLSLLSRKSYILATNDGSRSNELFDILRVKKPRFDYFFWRSAVMIPEHYHGADAVGTYPDGYDGMCLSMIGRIAEVKRQDRAAKILGELHQRGFPAHLYLVGLNDSDEILNRAKAIAKEYDAEAYLHIVGPQPQDVCRKYARNSLCTFLTGEWNRVNIFYEVMGEGSLLVTNNNHSIDEFIENGKNCVVYDTEAEAADRIIALSGDLHACKSMRRAAFETAQKKFMTVERRFGMEVQMLLDCASGKPLSNYPKEI